MHDVNDLLELLLSPSTQRKNHSDTRQWFNHFLEATTPYSSTIRKAIVGGRLSTRAGFAFHAGYQSAIEYLFSSDSTKLSSVCVTEKDGNHPRAIRTQLKRTRNNLQLSGSKTFVSGSQDAQLLFIACKEVVNENGEENNELTHPRLKMVCLPSDTSGISLQQMPALPFVPEVSHGIVLLENVVVEPTQILEGDGYAKFIKPFRTIEDVHVSAAILGYRLGLAIDAAWKPEWIEAHISQLLSLIALANNNLTKATSHIAFAGCRRAMHELLEHTDPILKETSPEDYQYWCRDKKLLSIAEKAHIVRTKKAWEAIESPK